MIEDVASGLRGSPDDLPRQIAALRELPQLAPPKLPPGMKKPKRHPLAPPPRRVVTPDG